MILPEAVEALFPSGNLGVTGFLVLAGVLLLTLPFVLGDHSEDLRAHDESWYEGLRDCAHRPLVVPPQCVKALPRQPSTINAITTRAVKRAKQYVSTGKGRAHRRGSSGASQGRGGRMSEGSRGAAAREAAPQGAPDKNGCGGDQTDLAKDGQLVVRSNGVSYAIDAHALPVDCCPLLVLVNSRSGAAQGGQMILKLRRLMNPVQVVDVASQPPGHALKQFSRLPRLRVLVCGGDGTVGWVLSALDALQLERPPPVGVLPLGTGNDLGRVLGWGGGYKNECLLDILKEVYHAHVTLLDRWGVTVTSPEVAVTNGGETDKLAAGNSRGGAQGRGRKGQGRGQDKQSRVRCTSFTNYFGVGVDAQAALNFHHMRESRPQLFFSRVVNKALYAMLGTREFFRQTCVALSDDLTLSADGKTYPLPDNTEGLIFMNVNSYAGGVRMWHDGEGQGSQGQAPSCQPHQSHPQGRGGRAAGGADTAAGGRLRRRSRQGSGALGQILGSAGLGLGRFLDCGEPDIRGNGSKNASSSSSGGGDGSGGGHGGGGGGSVAAAEDVNSGGDGGGRWGGGTLGQSSMQDGLLDVVAVMGVLHLGQMQVGLARAVKICQCREAAITTKSSWPMHVDGEPWGERPCTVRIAAKPEQAQMLTRTVASGGVMAMEMTGLFDWAEETRLIDYAQKRALLQEFSRRVEKTRLRAEEKERGGSGSAAASPTARAAAVAIGGGFSGGYSLSGGSSFREPLGGGGLRSPPHLSARSHRAPSCPGRLSTAGGEAAGAWRGGSLASESVVDGVQGAGIAAELRAGRRASQGRVSGSAASHGATVVAGGNGLLKDVW